MNIALLKKLSETPGVPGREERVREVLHKELKPMADGLTVDPMGSLIATIKTKAKNAKRLLLSCHIDEIGFYVRHVSDAGFVYVNNVGGFDTRNLLARRVLIQSSGDGQKDLVGLMNPSGRPTHIAKEEDRKKIPEITDFMIDLCMPAEQVKKKVRIGDPVTLIQDFMELGDCVTGKCMDNRVAAFIAIEAIKKCKSLKYEIILACTVQEEVGLRGAAPAAFTANPDLAVAIDTTLCVDLPGVPEDERTSKQGDGVALTIMDSSAIGNRPLIDSFEAVAKKHKIPHQLSILFRGGTDAGAIQRTRGGYPTMTLSVPTRYIHTVTECVHKTDLQSAIDLLAAWLAT